VVRLAELGQGDFARARDRPGGGNLEHRPGGRKKGILAALFLALSFLGTVPDTRTGTISRSSRRPSHWERIWSWIL